MSKKPCPKIYALLALDGTNVDVQVLSEGLLHPCVDECFRNTCLPIWEDQYQNKKTMNRILVVEVNPTNLRPLRAIRAT